MPKRFCVTGICIPGKNYMVDISERLDQIVKEYIEQGSYFIINRARQYGKTIFAGATFTRRLLGVKP